MESLNNTLIDTKQENKHTCCKFDILYVDL